MSRSTRPLPSTRTACAALLLAAGCWGAGALAVDGTELSLRLESLPTDYDFTITDGGVETDGDDSFDTAFGLAGGVRVEIPLGVAITSSAGLELLIGSCQTTDDHYLTVVGRAVVGYGYRVTRELTLGLEGWIGGGGGMLHIGGVSGADDADVNGGIFELGARVVGEYSFTPSWHLHAGLGWLRDYAHLTGDGLTVELTQRGPVAMVGFGWSY